MTGQGIFAPPEWRSLSAGLGLSPGGGSRSLPGRVRHRPRRVRRRLGAAHSGAARVVTAYRAHLPVAHLPKIAGPESGRIVGARLRGIPRAAEARERAEPAAGKSPACRVA